MSACSRLQLWLGLICCCLGMCTDQTASRRDKQLALCRAAQDGAVCTTSRLQQSSPLKPRDHPVPCALSLPSLLRLATAAGGDGPQKSLQAAPAAAQDVHLATRPALQGLLHTLPHSVTTFSVCPIPVGAAWQATGQQPSSTSGAGGDAVAVRLHVSAV